MNGIKTFWINHPLKSILIIALFVRLIAVIFSPGFSMQDDHFLIIETSSSWADGYNYSNWLPWHQFTDTPIPQGHSFFYPGLHYLYFLSINTLGIDDPKIQMFILRLLHGLFSLITVFLSYRITEKLGGARAAKIVAISLALGWAIPFYSVRNLVEIVCIPFYLYGLWHIIKNDFRDHWKVFLIAGLMFGIAFSVRLQMAVFYAGFGICLLLMKKWKGSMFLILGFGVGAFLTQGIIDYFIWDKPFAELIEYIRYNSSDAKYDYGGRWQWYKYIVVLTFFSIPIVGLFWLFGTFISMKKYYWLFVPLVVFTLFHTMYPNQQERFIFPMLPIFIMLGVMGWEAYREKSKFWTKRSKLWNIFNRIGWTLNIIMLIGAATYATKTAKVNSSYHFYKHHRGEQIRIVQEDSFGDDDEYEGNATLFPRFYTGNGQVYAFSINTLKDRKKWEAQKEETGEANPDFILLHGEKFLDKRIKYFKSFYPESEVVTTYKSSPVDQFLHYMNPKNRNEQVLIIKTNAH